MRRGGEYVFVYLPDWWWLVGCLGICVGRRAGADGGVCVAVSLAASLSTSVSGRDKGGQQDTHKQHIVVELMLIEIRHLSISYTYDQPPCTALCSPPLSNPPSSSSSPHFDLFLMPACSAGTFSNYGK